MAPPSSSPTSSSIQRIRRRRRQRGAAATTTIGAVAAVAAAAAAAAVACCCTLPLAHAFLLPTTTLNSYTRTRTHTRSSSALLTPLGAATVDAGAGGGGESQRYGGIMKEMAHRYTTGEEIYRSETGLKLAISELDKVEATARLLKEQEEEERQEELARLAEAARMRQEMMAGSSSSSSQNNQGGDFGSNPSSSSSASSFFSSFPNPFANVATAASEAIGAAEGILGGAATATGGATDTTNTGTGSSGSGSGSGFAFPEPELPDFLDVKSLGLTGRWEEVGGNFLLRPPDHATNPPRAVLHFLGGAFVGAAPHLTYRYLLNGLAERGFLVVATPYNLSFDYVQVCDRVLERFEKVAIPLAKEYGALPVVGIGHSCGALLHVLITCLFPDTPRLANALISFNNQKAQKAIPGFEEVVVPISVSLMGGDSSNGGGSSNSRRGGGTTDNGDAAAAAAAGLISEGGPLGPGTALRQSLGRLRQNVEEVVEAYSASPLAPSVVRNEMVPLWKQAMSIVDQLPPLLQSISEGTREFAPTPDDTREVCRRMYRARRTLLVQFEEDAIDESENLMKVLQESRSIMRMKRPLVKMDVRLETVKGTHITPLAQDLFVDPPAVLDVLNPLAPPIRRYAQEQFLATVRSVQTLLVEWLEEGLVPR